MKKILVPVDFSTCSENALLFAIQLADKIGATIQVLHVTSFNGNGVGNPAAVSLAIEEQFRKTKKLLNKSIQETLEKTSSLVDENFIIQADIEMGITDIKICEIATNSEIDLIVMGTYGTHNALEKYLGSNASKVMKSAPCTVLVIPESVEFEEQMMVAYVTDLLNPDPFEIWKSRQLLKSFQPAIKCVHFNEKQNVSNNKMEELATYFGEFAPRLNISFYNLPVKEKVKNMNDFIERHHINMIVMYKRQRNFFVSLFQKSLAEKMVMHTHVPLLIIK